MQDYKCFLEIKQKYLYYVFLTTYKLIGHKLLSEFVACV